MSLQGVYLYFTEKVFGIYLSQSHLRLEGNKRRSHSQITDGDGCEPESCKEESYFSGIIKTTFFFYQTVSIVRKEAS